MSSKLSYVLNKTPPYADTEVPYERTKAEIEILLKSYGVKGIRWTSLEGQDDVLEFIIEATLQGVKKQLGIAVKPPHIFIQKKLPRQGLVQTENINQEYRLLFYWIKSKIEAVVWGMSTVEREFLSEILLKLPDGSQSNVGAVVTNLMGKDTLQSLPFYGQTTASSQVTQALPMPPLAPVVREADEIILPKDRKETA
jgi:hypothetical protein